MPTLAFDGQEMKATYRDNDPNRKHKGAVITTVINCNDRTVAIYKIAQKKNQESGCFLLALKEKLILIPKQDIKLLMCMTKQAVFLLQSLRSYLKMQQKV